MNKQYCKILLLLLFVATWILFSCQEPRIAFKLPKKYGTLEIEFTVASGLFENREPKNALITLKDSLDNVILDKEKVPVDYTSNRYNINIAQLIEGHYSITEFVILDSLGIQTYYVPSEGSEFKEYVDIKLPKMISIFNDSITEVTLEVIPVNTLEIGLVNMFTFDDKVDNCISPYCPDKTVDRKGVEDYAIEFKNEKWLDFYLKIFQKKKGSVSFWISLNDTSIYQPLFFNGPDYSTPVNNEYSLSFQEGKIFGYTPIFRVQSEKFELAPNNWCHILLRWDYEQKKGDLIINNETSIKLVFYESTIFLLGEINYHIGKDYYRDNENHFGFPTEIRYGNFKFDELRIYDRYVSNFEIEILNGM